MGGRSSENCLGIRRSLLSRAAGESLGVDGVCVQLKPDYLNALSQNEAIHQMDANLHISWLRWEK
jgi:hypothetical protein